jgi:hypothetical protein
MDVLRQHRAASFHVFQGFRRQRIRLPERILLRNLADDPPPFHPSRASSNVSTGTTRG